MSGQTVGYTCSTDVHSISTFTDNYSILGNDSVYL